MLLCGVQPMKDFQRSFGVLAFFVDGFPLYNVLVVSASDFLSVRECKRAPPEKKAQTYLALFENMGVSGVVFIKKMQTVFFHSFRFCQVYFSDSVMCISLIEIGNLAEFWLWPIYWEASQSGVSGVCTSLPLPP